MSQTFQVHASLMLVTVFLVGAVYVCMHILRQQDIQQGIISFRVQLPSKRDP